MAQANFCAHCGKGLKAGAAHPPPAAPTPQQGAPLIGCPAAFAIGFLTLFAAHWLITGNWNIGQTLLRRVESAFSPPPQKFEPTGPTSAPPLGTTWQKQDLLIRYINQDGDEQEFVAQPTGKVMLIDVVITFTLRAETPRDQPTLTKSVPIVSRGTLGIGSEFSVRIPRSVGWDITEIHGKYHRGPSLDSSRPIRRD